jgi:hypothetical protein
VSGGGLNFKQVSQDDSAPPVNPHTKISQPPPPCNRVLNTKNVSLQPEAQTQRLMPSDGSAIIMMLAMARKLHLEISTSWWKGLRQCRPAAPKGASGGGQVHFGGRSGRNTPVSGPKFRSDGRRPFHTFGNFGPSAREFRPIDELASPEALLAVWAESEHGPWLH